MTDHLPEQPEAEGGNRRRPWRPRVLTLGQPPDPPPPTVITLMGYAVTRDDDGLSVGLQPCAHPGASYAEVYREHDNARLAAHEQLLQAYARGTYSSDARHVVPIFIPHWEARDFRPLPFSREALAIATHELSSSLDDSPWVRLAHDRVGGLVLPYLSPHDLEPDAGAYFVVISDDCAADDQVLQLGTHAFHTVALDDLF